MDYRLAEAQPGRAVLVRSRTLQFVLGGLFVLLGLPAAGLGAFVALADPLLGAKLGGFGLTFFGAGVLVLSRRSGPGAFVFDDAQEALLAYPSAEARGEPEGRLAYASIEQLRVKRQVHSSSEGRSVSYALDVVKKDGVSWTLYTSQSEGKARDLLRDLQANCNLTRRSREPAPLPESGTFEVAREAERTIIRFRKPYRVVTQLAAFMAVGGLSLAVLGFRDQMPNAVFYAVFAFITLVLAAVTVGAVNGLNKHGVLTVTPERFRSDEQGGIIKAWFEEPISQLHAVCFSYRPNEDQRVLMLLNRQQYDVLTQPPPEGAAAVLSTALSVIGVRKIDVGELGLAQKLELEQLIQSEVERVSGKRLL